MTTSSATGDYNAQWHFPSTNPYPYYPYTYPTLPYCPYEVPTCPRCGKQHHPYRRVGDSYPSYPSYPIITHYC